MDLSARHCIQISFLLLFSHGINSHDENDYYIADVEKNWDQEITRCVVAVPKIVYSETNEIITVDLPDNLTIDNTEHVWIGYKKTTQLFEIKGCMLDSDRTEKTVVSRLIKQDPGLCVAQCGVPYFGMSGNYCYCFGNNLPPRLKNLWQTYCTQHCESQRHAPCGGSSGKQKYVSVYMRVLDYQSPMGLDTSCRILNSDTDVYTWGNCNQTKRGLCFSGSNMHATRKSYTWMDALNQCLTMNISLMSERHFGHPLHNGTLWINGIRYPVISTFTNFRSENVAHEYFGYVSKSNGVYTLSFSESLHHGKILCVRGDSPTMDDKPTPEGNNNQMIAVYVTVPVIAIVAVFALFLIRRQRKLKAQQPATRGASRHPSDDGVSNNRIRMSFTNHDFSGTSIALRRHPSDDRVLTNSNRTPYANHEFCETSNASRRHPSDDSVSTNSQITPYANHECC